jgi:FkbM family methyltransferase
MGLLQMEFRSLPKKVAKRVVKKLAPESAKRFLRAAISKMDQKKVGLKEAAELSRLKAIPRFQEFNTDLLGNTIKGPDAASFFFMYRELMKDQIYDFTPSRPDPLILDCGANIGLSVIFFKQLCPNAKVIAFEPDTKIFKYLDFNVKSFGFDDVELVRKAVWNKDTTLSFLSEGADGGRVQTSIDKKSLIEIEAVDIMPYLDQRIEFLKLDIEGAELPVLERMVPKLGNVENMFVEYHSFGHEAQNLDRVLKLLTDAGFRYHITIPSVRTKRPLISVPVLHGMDLLLNIFASKHLPLR